MKIPLYTFRTLPSSHCHSFIICNNIVQGVAATAQTQLAPALESMQEKAMEYSVIASEHAKVVGEQAKVRVYTDVSSLTLQRSVAHWTDTCCFLSICSVPVFYFLICSSLYSLFPSGAVYTRTGTCSKNCRKSRWAAPRFECCWSYRSSTEFRLESRTGFRTFKCQINSKSK